MNLKPIKKESMDMIITTSKYVLQIFLCSIVAICNAKAGMREIELYQDEVLARADRDKAYVCIGEDANALVEVMRSIVSLADSHDVVCAMQAVLASVEQDDHTVSRDMLCEALEKEARALLEKHHARIAHDATLQNLVADLDAACELVASGALAVTDVQACGDDYGLTRGIKSKIFSRITVRRSATVGSLYVLGDEVVGGDLRVGGMIVGGDTGLNNLSVSGSSVHSTLMVIGDLTVGGLIVSGVPFTRAFVQGGNSFGEPAILGTNDAESLHFETSGTQRMQISNAGAVTINPPTSGVALTVNAATHAIGFVVQGNGSARAATITAGTSTGGGLLVRSGTGAGVPLEVTAATGQGNVATFIGNSNAATALTITPGLNRVGLTIEGSGTAAGLKVFDAAQVNTNHTYPLIAGGTQVTAGTFAPVFGQASTSHIGAPRMIWASVSADSMLVSQSGGILTVGHTGPGVYPITYDTFGATAPVVLVTAAPGSFAYASGATNTGVTVVTTPADADFSILIIGLAS